jgi:putative phosphoesterase
LSTRIAVLSDVHGNVGALEAVRKALKKEKPDVILIAGDLVMNGPEPGATVDAIRELERDGAIVVQGNTDVAVADADYAAAFPWMLESGVPDAMRLAAEWAHDALDDEQLGWLRRLPAERRVRIGDDLVLVTHASPGSQTQGFDQGLDPSIVYERISRTDARVICCGHTHIPEVREFGWRSSSTTAARATPSTATRPPRGRSSRSATPRRRRMAPPRARPATTMTTMSTTRTTNPTPVPA